MRCGICEYIQHIRLKIEMSKNLFCLLLYQKLSATTSSCVSSAVLDVLSLYFRCSRKQHRFDACFRWIALHPVSTQHDGRWTGEREASVFPSSPVHLCTPSTPRIMSMICLVSYSAIEICTRILEFGVLCSWHLLPSWLGCCLL